MAPFHLSNKPFQNLHSRDDDWYRYILQGKGNFRDSSYQSCQIWLLPERTDFLSLPFFKGLSKCLSVVSCVRAQTAQKWRGRILKHGVGFAASTDISPPPSRVKALYTTSQMTAPKAHCIPWTTTTPTSFWWTTPRQRSRTEPPSCAWPWRSTSQSSARDTGVSSLWGAIQPEPRWQHGPSPGYPPNTTPALKWAYRGKTKSRHLSSCERHNDSNFWSWESWSLKQNSGLLLHILKHSSKLVSKSTAQIALKNNIWKINPASSTFTGGSKRLIVTGEYFHPLSHTGSWIAPTIEENTCSKALWNILSHICLGITSYPG